MLQTVKRRDCGETHIQKSTKDMKQKENGLTLVRNIYILAFLDVTSNLRPMKKKHRFLLAVITGTLLILPTPIAPTVTAYLTVHKDQAFDLRNG